VLKHFLQPLEVSAVPLQKKGKTKKPPTTKKPKQKTKPEQKAAAQLSWCPHQNQFSISTSAARTLSSSAPLPVSRTHKLGGGGGRCGNQV